ncbi:hypothetical protein SAMN05216344_11491 [Polaromonas sp. OV174]|uniref:hypothetical protein n=1 Tax=Polaromonas sp. OV174 TaxID=1855300 RepID=UPI0008F11634|nr:hypothetical protein [Polaromonas sp. OV174]SFC33932.1 hypothetical protein SAMN05216344_11491 [Polaromonas sp. OV174]
MNENSPFTSIDYEIDYFGKGYFVVKKDDGDTETCVKIRRSDLRYMSEKIGKLRCANSPFPRTITILRVRLSTLRDGLDSFDKRYTCRDSHPTPPVHLNAWVVLMKKQYLETVNQFCDALGNLIPPAELLDKEFMVTLKTPGLT